jgi:G3E family GTPase
LAVAGSQTETARMGRWWAAVPKRDWPSDGRFEEFVAGHWLEPWGDRRQELVFIGIGMDEAGIRRRLDACLVQTKDFVPGAWSGLADPFPSWAVPALEHA